MRQGVMGGVLARSKSHPLLIESGSVARENLFAFVHFWMNQTNSPILELSIIFRVDFLKIIFSRSTPVKMDMDMTIHFGERETVLFKFWKIGSFWGSFLESLFFAIKVACFEV